MIKVRQIKIRVDSDNSIDNLKGKISKKYHIAKDCLEHFEITKRSIDARNKNEIFYVYEVMFSLNDE